MGKEAEKGKNLMLFHSKINLSFFLRVVVAVRSLILYDNIIIQKQFFKNTLVISSEVIKN
jgi:hypothetical protein